MTRLRGNLAIGPTGESENLFLYRSASSGDFYDSLTTNTYQSAIIFPAAEPLLITKVARRFNDWSYGTAPTYRISLQGVDSSGNPDGTIKGAGACYADFTPTGTGNDAKLVWFTLGASYQATRGELLALVVKYQSGTCNASNHTRISRRLFGVQGLSGQAYALYGDGSWTRDQYGPPLYAYSDGAVTCGAPYDTCTTTAVNSDSNPNEYALLFSIPTDLCAAATLRAARIKCTGPPAAKSFTLTLYDTDGTTVLATRQFDSDAFSRQGEETILDLFFTDTTLPILLAGSSYRLAIKPDQTTTALAPWILTHQLAADLSAYPMGTAAYLSTRYNAGAWSDTATSRPCIALILDEVYPTYPAPDPLAIPSFPFALYSASDGKTPLTGATPTAQTSKDGAAFTDCANTPTELSDGAYLIDLDGADQGATTTLLKFAAAGAITAFATLVR